MRVPFLDLPAQDRQVGADVRAAIARVLDDQQCILGPHVARFEAAMAAASGARHALGVGSGTDALALALAALGVGPGTVVLTTAFSFFATASVIARLGARALLADVDPHTLNLDPAAAAAVLDRTRENVRGIVPAHLFGRIADMPRLDALAQRHDLWIVEDAAQAVGARVPAGAAGTLGRAGCLSFYPTKNLGAVGDGGMVLTDDDELAQRIREDRHHGQVEPYVHARIGLCSRLDAVQAAALGAKLPHLAAWNSRRRTVAAAYTAAFHAADLAGSPTAPLVLPEPAGDAHVFHQYVVRANDRDALAEHLRANGIATQVYYRLPLHRQPALTPHVIVPTPLVETDRAASEVLALPIYPELTDTQLQTVVGAIATFYRAR